MRPSRHAGRTLIAAVALLFATLLIVETAYAQVAPEITQPATSLSQQMPSAAPHSGTGEDDCRPRQTARHTGHAPASPVPPGQMCGCDFRTGQTHAPASPVTMRDASRAVRSTALPLMHRALRC
ncbi:hypothetical protein H181DRAFT_05595 [Streptomyces sp. WMMB 714]|nr:hypothetical protein H181DRAFT_05595 [Streptomyces sp. WMMB 714]